jgi:peptidoglycan/LPS O-acetylase OafA/YrhL
VIFGLGLAFFILPIVRAEKRGAFSIGSIWMLLGAASYAIYLIHQPVISVLARLAVHSQMGWAATLLAMLVVSVGGGLAYYLLYEKPALAMIRRATRNRMMRPTVTS